MKKNIMNEDKVQLLKDMILTESNIEKAEIVLAVKGEIVDKLQRQSELLSNMRVDVLGPLLDRIKAENGVEAAENFKNSISGLLDQAVQTLMDVKDKISTETLKLTGDITSTADVGNLDADVGDSSIGMDEPTFDFEDDTDFEDIPEEPVQAAPVEREMKESQKLGVVLESVSGKVGAKYFNDKATMNQWLQENKNKIKRVINVIK